jgi:hypothetical protein
METLKPISISHTRFCVHECAHMMGTHPGAQDNRNFTVQLGFTA